MASSSLDLEDEARKFAGEIVARAIASFYRQRVFARLKRAISQAQQCLALDILKQFYPTEAQLLADPVFRPLVRLRLGGARFPPSIFFKVYLKRGVSSVQYFSGKKLIRPASEAAQDACKQMGKKQFLLQVLEDMEQAAQGLDELDVCTLKDFMKFTSTLDGTSADLGGRDNTWRSLGGAGPGVVADLVAYTRTGRPTVPLTTVMPQLREAAVVLAPSPALVHKRVTAAAKSLHLADSTRRAQHAARARRILEMRRLYQLNAAAGSRTPWTGAGGSELQSSAGRAFTGVSEGVALQESIASMITSTTAMDRPSRELAPDDLGDLDADLEEMNDEQLYQWSQDLPLDDAALADL
eukprot:m.40100 g.40100  ORF g.40100 m.40100 type:complete len:353 (+) comp10266_c0_seq1:36-1094(+)